MMKIDTHIHAAPQRIEKEASPWNPQACYCAEPEELIAHLRSQGIGKAILMSGGETDHRELVGNAACRRMAAEHPGVLYWMCNFDPDAPETVMDRMKRYRDMGAVGVGELMINRGIDDPMIQEIFRCAEILEMPVTFHMSPEPGYSYGICDRAGLPLLEESLRRYPGLKFFGHSQVFWLEISADCPKESNAQRSGMGRGRVIPGRIGELMDRYANLYCDLSAFSGSMAILRDPKYGLSFLEKYQDRLCYATDTMNRHETFPLGRFLDELAQRGALRQEAYEKIAWRNAENIYRI